MPTLAGIELSHGGHGAAASPWPTPCPLAHGSPGLARQQARRSFNLPEIETEQGASVGREGWPSGARKKGLGQARLGDTTTGTKRPARLSPCPQGCWLPPGPSLLQHPLGFGVPKPPAPPSSSLRGGGARRWPGRGQLSHPVPVTLPEPPGPQPPAGAWLGAAGWRCGCCLVAPPAAGARLALLSDTLSARAQPAAGPE